MSEACAMCQHAGQAEVSAHACWVMSLMMFASIYMCCVQTYMLCVTEMWLLQG